MFDGLALNGYFVINTLAFVSGDAHGYPTAWLEKGPTLFACGINNNYAVAWEVEYNDLELQEFEACIAGLKAFIASREGITLHF